ncbi:MAG: transposase, partial [Desulfurococcaceae archaeon]
KFHTKLKAAQDEEEGKAIMNQPINYVEQRNPTYAKEIEKKIHKYIAFLKYPEEVRSKIYTTNAVESINSGLEYMRMEHGGVFCKSGDA